MINWLRRDQFFYKKTSLVPEKGNLKAQSEERDTLSALRSSLEKLLKKRLLLSPERPLLRSYSASVFTSTVQMVAYAILAAVALSAVLIACC
jgi:hypothetical protein